MKKVILAQSVPQTTTYTFSLDDPDLKNKIAAMFADLEEDED